MAHCAVLSSPLFTVLGSTALGGLAPYLRACTERAVLCQCALARAGRWRCALTARAAHTFIFPEILLLLAAGCRTRVTSSLTRLWPSPSPDLGLK